MQQTVFTPYKQVNITKGTLPKAVSLFVGKKKAAQTSRFCLFAVGTVGILGLGFGLLCLGLGLIIVHRGK